MPATTGDTSHAGERTRAEQSLRVWVDEARRGRVAAVVEVCRLLRETGRFRGLRRPEIRRMVGGWLAGCNPDVVSEGWARFIAQGGLR
jgi:hypothetical protein